MRHPGRKKRPAAVVAAAPLGLERPLRIAVLGAGGFVGSHIVPRLAARPQTEIHAGDLNLEKLEDWLPGVRRIEADIAEPGLIDELTRKVDVVVSLTALCNPALYNT